MTLEYASPIDWLFGSEVDPKKSAQENLQDFAFFALDWCFNNYNAGGNFDSARKSKQTLAAEAERRKNIATYSKIRLLRPPTGKCAARRVTYAHSAPLSAALKDAVQAVEKIGSVSIREGHGGREGMSAALKIAILLLGRLPEAELRPVIHALMDLDEALGCLNRGIVRSALKADRTSITRGRKRESDPLRVAFKLRCIVAARLSRASSDVDPFGVTFDAAHETALLVGPFKTVSRNPPLKDKTHPGPLVFSSETIQNWCEEHTTALNESVAKRNRLEGRTGQVQEAISLAMKFGAPKLFRDVWLRSLRPENIGKSMQTIIQEADVSFGYQRPRHSDSRK